MKLVIGSDHGGFLLKEEVKKNLINLGHDVMDMGCYSLDSVDYPVFASKVGKEVAKGNSFGILICTTGVGISIAANKCKGIRAALVTNEDQSKFSRMHNNANVICMGAKYTDGDTATNYVLNFINTEFEGGRHERRVSEIMQIQDDEM